MANRRDAFFNVNRWQVARNQEVAQQLSMEFPLMNNEQANDTIATDEEKELLGRRLFLQSIGKWSGAAIAAALFGGAWLALPPEANAGGWVNRRGGGGGGAWVNRRGYGGGAAWGYRGGGGGWINGGGGGGWVNRRNYGGGGAWINRW